MLLHKALRLGQLDSLTWLDQIWYGFLKIFFPQEYGPFREQEDKDRTVDLGPKQLESRDPKSLSKKPVDREYQKQFNIIWCLCAGMCVFMCADEHVHVSIYTHVCESVEARGQPWLSFLCFCPACSFRWGFSLG